jgi:hypothetical protein
MVDGERCVVRDQQELATTAEERLTGDVHEHFPFKHEQEGIPGKSRARDFRSTCGKLGFDLPDIEGILLPYDSFFPVRNSSFLGFHRLTLANIEKNRENVYICPA